MDRDSNRSGSGLRRSGFYQGAPNPGPDIGTLVGAAGKFMKSYKGDKEKEEEPDGKGKGKGKASGPGATDVASIVAKFGPVIMSMLG